MSNAVNISRQKRIPPRIRLASQEQAPCERHYTRAIPCGSLAQVPDLAAQCSHYKTRCLPRCVRVPKWLPPPSVTGELLSVTTSVLFAINLLAIVGDTYSLQISRRRSWPRGNDTVRGTKSSWQSLVYWNCAKAQVALGTQRPNARQNATVQQRTIPIDDLISGGQKRVPGAARPEYIHR